ncbi:hypothetical protein D9758_014053 [Tetrapyrgos nigripes]|uniref:Uncharacterized protein n=1 Tax=Tetrapyrgos nigripes TaxID=182062 RepID=A0A8H5FM17_9AGAR|nr:hypothetical protein D9758_014053 [Tetrapyrgos nigripes]
MISRTKSGSDPSQTPHETPKTQRHAACSELFAIWGPIESIVPNHTSRSVDITLFYAAGIDEFIERAKHPHEFKSLRFKLGAPSKLPVHLLAVLASRNASRALKLTGLSDHMKPGWSLEVLSKFGNVEKLDVNAKAESAVVHYMSVTEAVNAMRSMIKGRLIGPQVEIEHTLDRCDSYDAAHPKSIPVVHHKN